MNILEDKLHYMPLLATCVQIGLIRHCSMLFACQLVCLTLRVVDHHIYVLHVDTNISAIMLFTGAFSTFLLAGWVSIKRCKVSS